MKKLNTKKKNRTLEIIALVVALLCLTMGFLAFSSYIKISSEVTARPDKLSFRIVFSSEDDREITNPIEAIKSSAAITASDAIINNYRNPVITNLGANFTEFGQKVSYKFYIYNAGEYTGYLNDVIYENIGNSDTSKLCITKDGRITEEIKKACDNIKISVKIGDTTTSKSLYDINNKFLRPRTAQPIEVTIEYLENDADPKESFDVLFGDIRLYYSMFDNKSSHVS